MLKKKASQTNRPKKAKCLPAVTRFWSSLTPWLRVRSVCVNASRRRYKLGLRIGQPGDQRVRPTPPSPPAPPPRSPSGAHTQEAAGCRPAFAAALTSTLLARPPPSLPPSPFPFPRGRVHTAPLGQPRARRARAPAPPLPAPRVAVQSRTSSSPTEPAKGIGQHPGPAPQTQPPGEDE